MTDVTNIEVVHDDVSARIDEMADLCAHWQRWRGYDGRGYVPRAIRAAIVMLANEVVMLEQIEREHGQRSTQL